MFSSSVDELVLCSRWANDHLASLVTPNVDGAISRANHTLKCLWPLIRGAPHNRLAWIVATAGLLIVSGPFWEALSAAVQGDHFRYVWYGERITKLYDFRTAAPICPDDFRTTSSPAA